MEIVYLLVPLALVLVVIAVIGFIFALKRGQFDDLETPAMRILFEETDKKSGKKE